MNGKFASCIVKVKRKGEEQWKFVFTDHYLPATNFSLGNELGDV